MLSLRRLPPLAVVLAAGCWPSQAIQPPPPAAPHLPVLPRTLAVPDVSQVPDELPPLKPPAGDYLHLTAEQCRHLACEHAPLARTLIAVARADDRGYLFDSDARAESAHLRRVLARRLAQEARNRAAGAALGLYYQLLEAELLADLLAAGVAEADALVRTAEGFRERGFTEPVEPATLRKQQADARTELLRVQLGARKLNGELKAIIGLGCTPGNLLPTDRVRVVQDRLDPDAAVQVACARRADLAGLRELDAGLTPMTAEVARQAVLGLVPAVQPVAAAHSLPLGLAHFLPRLLDADVTAYRQLLREALAQRQQDADKEVRAAVDEWATGQDLVAVAKRRAAAERQRLTELTARKATGAAVEAEYSAARLEALRADAELIREALKWKRADVAARQAMGLLCGDHECP